MTRVQTAMETKLSTWLNYECKSRGWSHRQLGEKAGVSGQMVSGVIAGDRNPGWDFCLAVAKPLGKDPVEVFRMAGLLPPESHGENEPALLHHYRQLSPPDQRAAVAMLRGLAGQQGPVAQPPAEGANIDAVCQLLARLDSSRLEMAAIFIRWLIDQPGTGEPESRPATWEDVAKYFASLSPEKRETLLTNLIRRFGQYRNPDAAEGSHSEEGPLPGQGLGQGTLF